MRTALVVGGMPVANQLHRLKSGVEVRLLVMTHMAYPFPCP